MADALAPLQRLSCTGSIPSDTYYLEVQPFKFPIVHLTQNTSNDDGDIMWFDAAEGQSSHRVAT